MVLLLKIHLLLLFQLPVCGFHVHVFLVLSSLTSEKERELIANCFAYCIPTLMHVFYSLFLWVPW